MVFALGHQEITVQGSSGSGNWKNWSLGKED